MFCIWEINIWNHLSQYTFHINILLFILLLLLFCLFILFLLLFTTTTCWLLNILCSTCIFLLSRFSWLFLNGLNFFFWLSFNKFLNIFWSYIDRIDGHTSCCCKWILFFDLNLRCLIELMRSQKTQYCIFKVSQYHISRCIQLN